MVDVITIAFVLGGAVLLLSGAVLSSYGVGIMGLFLGGGSGYLLAPTIAGALGLEGVIAIAVTVVGGALVGVALTYALLSVAIAAISFVMGTFIGFTTLAPVLVDGSWFVEWAVALGIGIAAAAFGMFLTKTTMVLITSFLGAALASRSLTADGFIAAQTNVSLDPLLFDVTAPLFMGLFVLGVLSQFGLFKLGWLTKLVPRLPQRDPLRGREPGVK